MGVFFERLSAVTSPARMRASAPDAWHDSWYPTPEGWISSLGTAGVNVTPELALTLSHVHCAVSTISDDFGTMSCQFFRDLGKDGRDRVRYSDPGIGALAYRLRWQPNNWQTAKAFWSTLGWQYLLRPCAYAEIIYRPGSESFVDQIIPRHPDRVEQQVLPSGRLRFKLREADGRPRYVTQDEMFVVRNTSTDGLNAIGRIQYGANALAASITMQDFTRNYFKKGATAALIGSYEADLSDEQAKDLHASVTRYMSGVENAGGLMLVQAGDLDIKQLGVDPEKAELLGLKNLGGRDVARMFKIPASWLMIEDAQSYGSQVQDTENYKVRCQMPMVVEFEQAIQRDLVVAKSTFFAKFNMDYLARADLLTRMQSYEIGIRSRVIRPSEARVREDYSPDPRLDQLSEGDYRPGTNAPSGAEEPTRAVGAWRSTRASLRETLLFHDAAVRCVRRERHRVAQLAMAHPSDVEKWQAELREFYADQATFIARTMRLPDEVARAYAAQHGSVIEANGIGLMTDAWERSESEELAALSLDLEARAA